MQYDSIFLSYRYLFDLLIVTFTRTTSTMMRILIYVTLLLCVTACAKDDDDTTQTADNILELVVDRDYSLLLYNGTASPAAELLVVGTDTLQFAEDVTTLEVGKSYPVEYLGEDYVLHKTALPIVSISTVEAIDPDTKVDGNISLIDAGALKSFELGIEYRGGFSLTFDKKSYTLELRDADGSSNKKPLLDLRDDDDWILDALYNEPLRVRDYVAHELWLSFGRVSDPGLDPISKGSRRVYCEVFENGSYRGVYYLGERIDRKQLDLAAPDADGLQGELYKGVNWDRGTTWQAEDNYDDTSESWSGWELKYPEVEDNEFSWKNMYDLLQLVTDAEDAEFAERIGTYIDIDNIIDYYLLINMLQAEDNVGKNIYIARSSSDGRYYFLPWDLDGVMGRNWRGDKTDSPVDKIVTNPLFDRLLAVPAVVSRIQDRWNTLKDDQLSANAIEGMIRDYYGELKQSNVYEREDIRDDLSFRYSEEELIYLSDWLQQRYAVVENHVSSL